MVEWHLLPAEEMHTVYKCCMCIWACVSEKDFVLFCFVFWEARKICGSVFPCLFKLWLPVLLWGNSLFFPFFLRNTSLRRLYLFVFSPHCWCSVQSPLFKITVTNYVITLWFNWVDPNIVVNNRTGAQSGNIIIMFMLPFSLLLLVHSPWSTDEKVQSTVVSCNLHCQMLWHPVPIAYPTVTKHLIKRPYRLTLYQSAMTPAVARSELFPALIYESCLVEGSPAVKC